MRAPGRKQPHPAARAASLIQAAAHSRIENVRHVTFARFLRGPAAKKLGKEDLRQSLKHNGRSFRKYI